MPVRTSYQQGTPNWVDLQTPDPAGAKAFYAGLLGWTYDDMAVERGVGGKAKTGVGVGGGKARGTPDPPMPGVPNKWQVYFAVDNADEAAARAAGVGGTVLVEPFDIPVGRIAVIADPK